MVDQKQQKKARDRINTHNLYNQRSKEKGFEGVHCFITNGNGVGSGSFRAARVRVSGAGAVVASGFFLHRIENRNALRPTRLK